jgi:predicted nuclease with TOPRIM domain
MSYCLICCSNPCRCLENNEKLYQDLESINNRLDKLEAENKSLKDSIRRLESKDIYYR